jgi:endonuclease G, mitochondrial
MSRPRRKRKSPKSQKSKQSFLIFFLLIMLIFSLAIYTMNQLEKAELEGKALNLNQEQTKGKSPEPTIEKESKQLTSGKEKIPSPAPAKKVQLEEYISTITATPEFSYPVFTSDQSGETINHTAISLSYDEENEQAYWVSYRLTADMLGGSNKRSNKFKEDPKVSTQSASPTDYRLSGYDRGHLAPAGDFTTSGTAMEESFYMSNMSPQVPAFNRGIWKKLEDQVRYWAKANEEIYIICGPVVTEKELTLGQNKVAVPQYFYKVVLDIHPPEYKAIAFLLKNEKSSRPLLDFAITVDSLERFTGLDFFPMLPDTLEYRLENMKNHEIWFE